jgi:hypothetical protein
MESEAGTKQAVTFEVETEWLREFARTYMPCEAMFSYPVDLLRAAGVSLVDVKNLMASCTVVDNEKLDEPGALFTVVGEECDGGGLRAVFRVVSQEYDVTLMNVERISAGGGAPDDAA